jgi:5'-phosphate synthase pdxT subunit
MVVGILALQGCVTPHLAMFRKLAVDASEVRTERDLDAVDRLVLPGGESSTMLKLLITSGLWEPLGEFVRRKPVLGICAGAILLAQEVQSPAQPSLGAIPIRAHRNFYGSQLDSFEASFVLAADDSVHSAQFIRAPLLEPLSSDVRVVATCESKPVVFACGTCLASACHTELGSDPVLHQLLLAL